MSHREALECRFQFARQKSASQLGMVCSGPSFQSRYAFWSILKSVNGARLAIETQRFRPAITRTVLYRAPTGFARAWEADFSAIKKKQSIYGALSIFQGSSP